MKSPEALWTLCLLVLALLLIIIFRHRRKTTPEEAMPLDSENGEAFEQRGNVRMLVGEVEKAILDYDEAIRLLPENAMTYYYRGVAWLKKDKAKCISDLSEAVRLNPELGIAFWTRSVARLGTKDYDGAMEDSDRAIELEPMEGRYYRHRALVWKAKKDYAKAISRELANVGVDTTIYAIGQIGRKVDSFCGPPYTAEVLVAICPRLKRL